MINIDIFDNCFNTQHIYFTITVGYGYVMMSEVYLPVQKLFKAA